MIDTKYRVPSDLALVSCRWIERENHKSTENVVQSIRYNLDVSTKNILDSIRIEQNNITYTKPWNHSHVHLHMDLHGGKCTLK